MRKPPSTSVRTGNPVGPVRAALHIPEVRSDSLEKKLDRVSGIQGGKLVLADLKDYVSGVVLELGRFFERVEQALAQ
jgi:hypothetical protein